MTPRTCDVVLALATAKERIAEGRAQLVRLHALKHDKTVMTKGAAAAIDQALVYLQAAEETIENVG